MVSTPLLILTLGVTSVLLAGEEPFFFLCSMVTIYLIAAAAEGTAGAVVGLLVFGVIAVLVVVISEETSWTSLDNVVESVSSPIRRDR